MSLIDTDRTVGALLAGGLIATAFTGVITVQSYTYSKRYPNDAVSVKLLVSSVWFLDFGHTIFISLSLWYYLISNFGHTSKIDSIPWSLAMTIAFTAVLTFLVHCFFIHRIHKLSFGKWIIVIPLAALAVARLGFAVLTTSQMIILDSLGTFTERFHWSFTLGLALSSTVDVFITACLCFFLSSSRRPLSSMNAVIDTLIIYAFENGILTCAATIVSMICWLAMPHNLIFMGLHFIISKLYANSLLATLNTRKRLRGVTCGREIPVVFTEDFAAQPRGNIFSRVAHTISQDGGKRGTVSPKVQINVRQTTEYAMDEGNQTKSNIV